VADERTQISVVIDPKLRQRLRHASIDTGLSHSQIVSEALERWLDDHKL
jgi:predicted DNA-binding protein